tara:strand:- start:7302 stop:7457 length:156 start_codon:yes stop_codon:yes gene_type:complete
MKKQYLQTDQKLDISSKIVLDEFSKAIKLLIKEGKKIKVHGFFKIYPKKKQ